MTLSLFQTLNKHLLYNLLPEAAFVKTDIPVMAPLGSLSFGSGAPLTCTCCGWKGSELKARKHYLVVESIAELELFCPSCNQYLGFIAEPASR
jgi:hypothetical protein